MCKHIVMPTVFPELCETERFQIANVTFKVIKVTVNDHGLYGTVVLTVA